MIDLQKYLFNDVVLVDIDNKTWKGHVFSFYYKDVNEENENSITLKTANNENLIEFTESEIQSIKTA